MDYVDQPTAEEHGTRHDVAIGRPPGRKTLPDFSLVPTDEVRRPIRSLRVLLVEDNADIRFFVVEMLHVLGHTVMDAGTGTQALQLLESHRFDVIVADLSLPGMSGTEVVAAALGRQPGLGVVIASGYDGLPAKHKTGALARAVYLRKPYDEAALDRALKSALASVS